MEFLVIVVLIGLIPATIARKKGRSFITWWIYGGLLFIIALPHALLLKTDQASIENRLINEGMKKCPYCAEVVKGDAKVCRYCGRDIGDVAPTVAPPKSKFRWTTLILSLILLVFLAFIGMAIMVTSSIQK